MKRSKKMLYELTNVPIVRKTLQTEADAVKMSHLQPGDVIEKKGKKFIITNVSSFGGYVQCVPMGRMEQFSKSDLVNSFTVSKGGLQNPRPITEG